MKKTLKKGQVVYFKCKNCDKSSFKHCFGIVTESRKVLGSFDQYFNIFVINIEKCYLRQFKTYLFAFEELII